VRPERTRVIHNAITLARVKNVAADARASRRAELGLSEDARVLTLIGRIHPVKGHSGMLRTMPAVLESCPKAVLVCVGDGPDRGDYEALAEQIGVRSNVHFLGQRNDVPEWLAASDLVVIPSLSEGLPFAAIEALAAGKPIVAHRVGGLTEVIDDGVDGTLVALGDRQAFAQAIVTLLTDASLMERYSRAASVEAERFSLERHVDSLKRLYRDIDRGTVA
jgi:glycosyltransferase involved in cell wall biosynthesis